jgi:hypothetical protein
MIGVSTRDDRHGVFNMLNSSSSSNNNHKHTHIWQSPTSSNRCRRIHRQHDLPITMSFFSMFLYNTHIVAAL